MNAFHNLQSHVDLLVSNPRQMYVVGKSLENGGDHIQHIVRTYDGRQSCVLFAELEDQTYEAHT